MKTLCVIAFAFLVPELSTAQLPDYYVYLTYGEVWIQQNGGNGIKIKPRQFVYASDIIELKNTHSEIELVDKENNFVVLNAKGIYKANTLKERTTKKTEGLTRKYLGLVWASIAHSSTDFEVYKNESVAASWGGGARGSDCNIEKYPSSNSILSSDSLIFHWQGADANSYRYNLYDSNQNTIFELLVRDTQLIMLTPPFGVGEYYWSVYSSINPCKQQKKIKITLISKDDEIIRTDSIIRQVAEDKDLILYNLNISDTLGKAGYIEKALNYFNKAWELFRRK
jgi:hypothetical protein